MAGLRLHRRRGGAGGAGSPLIPPPTVPGPGGAVPGAGGEDGRGIARDLDFAAARERVAGLARVTPLLPAPELSERVGRPVLLKLESLQPTGSFKVRGASARLGALTPRERERGVVACSSGNHGRAVAWVARRLGIPATVFVPGWVDPVKLEGIRGQGAEAVVGGDTYDEAEERALARAGEDGRAFVSAYDDPWVIAGQGTLALEVMEALAEGREGWWLPGSRPSALLVPLSGGGLAGGVAAALLARDGSTAPPVVAVSAERARVMLESVRAGRPVSMEEEETLASALAGGIGPDNRWSFPLVRDLMDQHAVVTEDEIKQSISFCYNTLRIVAEGGGAVGVAALLAGRWRPDEGRSGPVVVVVSGGNLDPGTLHRVLQETG